MSQEKTKRRERRPMKFTFSTVPGPSDVWDRVYARLDRSSNNEQDGPEPKSNDAPGHSLVEKGRVRRDQQLAAIAAIEKYGPIVSERQLLFDGRLSADTQWLLNFLKVADEDFCPSIGRILELFNDKRPQEKWMSEACMIRMCDELLNARYLEIIHPKGERLKDGFVGDWILCLPGRARRIFKQLRKAS